MRDSRQPHTVGIVSDTHGLLRPEVSAALVGVRSIIHCGDVGNAMILSELRKIAPVTAVRGNNDAGDWASELPETAVVKTGGIAVFVLHDLKRIEIDPAAESFDVVLAGHSHKPQIAERNGVLYVNPGSCGPRRFRLPVTLAILDVYVRPPSARIIELPV